MPKPLDSLSPSDGMFAFCTGIQDHKKKYGICICSDAFVFMLFGSKAHKFRAAALIECGPEEFPFLDYKCFLDTGQHVPFEDKHVAAALEDGKVWPISDTMKKAIKAKVLFHGQLPGKWEKHIVENY